MKMVKGALCTSMCSVSTDVEGNEFDPIVFSWFSTKERVESIKLVGEFYGSCKGILGGKSKLDEICRHLSEDEYNGIGSVNFRCAFRETNMHVIVFSTGKMKLSGGTPSNVTNDAELKEFLDAFYRDLCKWLVVCTKDFPNVCCLNGNEKLNGCSEGMLKNCAENGTERFASIVRPNLELKGRRCAYKFYIHTDRKLHLAVDYKGSMQVFAARSFDEMNELVDLFKGLCASV